MTKVNFAALSRQAQVAIVLGVLSTYLMAFFLLFPLIGETVFIMAVLPVVAVGWFWGSWAGILAGFLSLLLNKHLLNLARLQGWSVLVHYSGGLLGTFALLFVGVTIGRLRDLSIRLHSGLIERKWVEQELKQSEKRYRDLYEEAPYAYLSIGDDKRILLSNRRASELLGYSPDDLIGTSAFGLYEDTETGKEKARKLFQRFDAGGEIQNEEMLMRRRNGELIWISLTILPVKDAQGKIVRSRFLVVDITERKQAEEEIRRYTMELEELVAERAKRIKELERQRMEAEKIIALGQIAAGVAHEINNPLGSIKNCFYIVKRALPSEHGVEEFVQFIDNAIERITAIVREMYRLYQPRFAEVGPVSINEILGDVLTAMKGAMSACAVILHDERNTSVPEAILPVGELAQIFTNILRNALDEMPEGGPLRIKTSKYQDRILVEIADTGEGIPLDVLPHIFEPFFTTKTSKLGEPSRMGLGLSVTRSLVEGMGGHIEVKTELGVGTCVIILLPLEMKKKVDDMKL